MVWDDEFEKRLEKAKEEHDAGVGHLKDQLADSRESLKTAYGDDVFDAYDKKYNPDSKGKASDDDELRNREDKPLKPSDDQDPDSDEAGFFKDDGKQKSGFIGRARSSIGKRKGIALGLGGGGLIGIGVIAMMFSHLSMFQLDGLLKGIDSRTEKRLNVTLNTRNKYLVRAYIKARILDTDGDKTGDNTIFFSADKIDDSNPFKKWYRTMRGSKFEQDLLDKQGIKFLSLRNPDGSFKTAQVLIKDDGIPPKIINKYADVLGKPISEVNARDLSSLLTRIDDADLDYFVEIKQFKTRKDARLAVNAAVKENTHSYQVFKRRHMRKDIFAMSGISEWKLFENSREKLAKKKLEIKSRLMNKVVDKFYGNNPGPANMLKCLFSDGKCSVNTDVESDENRTGSVDTGTSIDGHEDPAEDAGNSNIDPDNPFDADGNPTAGNSGAGEREIAGTISDSIHETLDGSTDADKGLSTKAAAKLEVATPGQKIIYAIIAKILNKNVGEVIDTAARFEDPTKIWVWAVRISKIDGMITGGKSSKIVKMVLNARRSQLVGLYATYQIAASQMHTGQLSGEEASALMDTVNGFGNSEGWAAINGNFASGTASAAATDNISKQAYCAEDTSQRTAKQFAWMCDDQKPNGSSNAQALATGYANTVGKFISPIAAVIRGINNSPIGKAFTWLNNIVGSIIDKVTGPVIDAILKNTGLGKTLTSLMTNLMMRLITFLGAGPMYDGSQKGNSLANLLVAGGAATAEDSTRDSGGIASTPKSLSYVTKLVDQHDAEQKSRESAYDRYASLDNPDSLASTVLMSIHPSDNVKGVVNNVAGLFTSFPRYLGDILTGRMFVHADTNGGQIADWAGVPKYDIPPACITLDPLDPDYIDKATNADHPNGPKEEYPSLKGSALGYDTLRDGNQFWSTVYSAIGKDNQTTAEKIYNCALLDARVEGSLGAIYGYNADGGMGD